MSVALHAVSTVLLFLALLKMTGSVWPSAFVAAVFGVHPLNVESVAWIAERKNVLSALFGMLALWSYADYAQRGGLFRYLLVAACLGLGLMCKPMLVTLPFVLLLLDIWPLGRWRIGGVSVEGVEPVSWPRLVIEKLPLFGLVVASSIVTTIVQSKGGAVGSVEA